MDLYEKMMNKESKLSVIGLGYVGLPIAIEFAKKIDVIGFDINVDKIRTYNDGHDPTNEVGDKAVLDSTVYFTSDEKHLKDVDFHIVSVPTPINVDKTPDLYPVESATRLIARNLKKGAYVVFESTVYPGVTEEVCIPILEEVSGLKCGTDFKVGYSPERINPGDKVNTLTNIVKVVSGVDKEALNTISDIYKIIIEAGTFETSSIKVAEAAKVVENSQRDINIAFMNELAIVFDKMNIDTNEVVKAMNTKWNALPFTPGLVGGHCIGVDPYYFLYQAEKLGYHSQIVQSGRKINDSMGEFVSQAIIKKLIETNKIVKEAKIYILGVTFKENTPDTRNSKVFDISKGLHDYGISVDYVDNQADKHELKSHYGVDLVDLNQIDDADCIVFAVSHKEFLELTDDNIGSMFKSGLSDEEKVIIDVKGIFNREKIEELGYTYWNL